MSVSDLLHRDVMVINQKPKLIEMTNAYRIRDADGADIGSIRQEGQSKVKKALRLFTDVDQFLTHRLGVYDGSGAKVMAMVRPRKILKSTLQILDARRRRAWPHRAAERGGQEAIRPAEPSGRRDRARSTPRTGGRGTSRSTMRAGAEVGRITKQWAGVLREGFTTADHYMFQVTGAPSPDLRFLMVAAAAGVDTALKQDDTGGFGFGGLDLFD